MDHPTFAVANAAEANSTRLVHGDQARGEVSCIPKEMPRLSSATHSPIRGRRPVPRHDGQRPADSSSESLKLLDEFRRRSLGSPGSVVLELPPAEVRGEVTHVRRS